MNDRFTRSKAATFWFVVRSENQFEHGPFSCVDLIFAVSFGDQREQLVQSNTILYEYRVDGRV